MANTGKELGLQEGPAQENLLAISLARQRLERRAFCCLPIFPLSLLAFVMFDWVSGTLEICLGYSPAAAVCFSKRAHPDLNQGPADLQSAVLATELCTHVMRA